VLVTKRRRAASFSERRRHLRQTLLAVGGQGTRGRCLQLPAQKGVEALLASLQVRTTPLSLETQCGLQWLQPGPKQWQIFGGETLTSRPWCQL
jgi:hypothetical protein